jgi:hypothetical protein
MEHQLSLPLSLLHDHHHDGFDNKRSKSLPQPQDDVDDDVSITPSTRRRYNRVSHEYAEIDTTAAGGDVDNGHKIVVGFLVPALLIVQWGVEWHNDEDFANLTEQALAACSLFSILFFMVLAPCFIEATSTTSNATTTITTVKKQYTSLTPIVLLCLADVLVALRMDLGALAIMVLGNVYMAWVVTAAWGDKKKNNNNGNLRTDDSSDSLTEGLLLLSSSTTSGGSVEEQRGADETAV